MSIMEKIKHKRMLKENTELLDNSDGITILRGFDEKDASSIVVYDFDECKDKVEEKYDVKVIGDAKKGTISSVISDDESLEKLDEASEKLSDAAYSKIIANKQLSIGFLTDIETHSGGKSKAVFVIPHMGYYYDIHNKFTLKDRKYHVSYLKGYNDSAISWLLKSIRRVNQHLIDDLKFKDKIYNPNDIDTLFESNNRDITVLLYSGGKDSTCRLLELLDEGKNVLPVIFQFNSHNQKDIFKTEIILHQFYKIADKVNHKGRLYAPLNLFYSAFHTTQHWQGFSQQQIIPTALSMLSEDILRKTEAIEYCLVNGDQGISWIHEMKKLYKTGMMFNEAHKHIELPKLVFPYTKTFKRDIYRALDKFIKKYDLGAIYTPSCQDEAFTNFRIFYDNENEDCIRAYLAFDICPCEDCSSCKTMNDWGLHELTTTIIYELLHDVHFLENNSIDDVYIDVSNYPLRDQL